jgi:hypothetical protein
MYIPRIAEEKLKRFSAGRKAVIVLGARQVGKTTMIKHIFNRTGVVFLNLDIEVDKQTLVSAGHLPPKDAMVALGNPEILVIDEAQRLPETGRIVKGWYDFGIKTKIILLGSSSLNLLSQTAESLTGRNEKLSLPPLTFGEIIKTVSWYSPEYKAEILAKDFAPQVESMLLERLVFGSYPEAVTSPHKEDFLLNLVSDYLLKDILQFGLVKSHELIKKLLMLLALQAGSLVSTNELSLNLGISRLTVDRYLELLEETFVIFRLPAFSGNPRKEISKSKKIYFWDTGIRNALLKEFSYSLTRPDIGMLWENWVVAEFAKNNLLEGKKRNLYFWRNSEGSEVDLVVKDNGILSAFEIKWTDKKVKKRAFENLYKTEVRVINKENALNFLQNP